MVNYRPAGEEDVAGAVEVFVEAVGDLYARNGVTTAPPPDRRTIEQNYRHILRTGIFHVAEAEGRVAAICHAVVRGPVWFLSGFWALPSLQRQRIGGAMLRRVMEEGAAAGATVFFTWSSIDLTAMAAYMKAGMLPGYQILTFSGRLPEETAGPEGAAEIESQPLTVSSAAALDERVRAARREVDHEFWLSEVGLRARQLVRGGKVVGYFYLNGAAVGPAAWDEELGAEALLAAACRELRGRSEEVRLMAPGVNHDAIRFALGRGLRLVAFSHLLTTSPFGRMERYLPSGPSLF